ncbi:dihydrofolate reductase family protein [Actinomadura sp. 6N118]|uniref:dihydrofolate reductase family protein n=1 Tax=Actinomadura sp. 6N118 TaxID=3375151 RepID=UPI0037A1E98D
MGSVVPPLGAACRLCRRRLRPRRWNRCAFALAVSPARPPPGARQAREAAGGQDVRLGGGPSVVRDFLTKGLVDRMHVVQVPILLGRGVRLWDGLESLEEAYDIEAVSTPSDVTHLTFTAKRR